MSRTTFSGPVASEDGFISVSDSGKTLAIKAPTNLTADTTLTFPDGAGSNGQYLRTNGTGTLTWAAGDGTGTVTSVSGAGTVNGLTLTGTVTETGSLTLGGNFALTATTAAALGDEGNAINTAGKYTGKMVVVLSTGLIFTATGPNADEDWKGSDGTTSITPTS